MLSNSRAMFNWDDPKTMSNLIVGFVVLALGLIPLLNQWGFIAFDLPGFLSNVIARIGLYVIAGLGLWLLVDGFMEDDTIRMVTVVTALLFLVIGIIPLLASFGVIAFTIPFLTVTVYNVIFVIEGLLLIIAAFATF